MGVKKFIWDELSDNVLLETDENDVVTAAYHHRPEQFGELISQNRSGVDRFFHFDGNHSTSDLTASNQKVTDTFSFTAYGEEVARTGTTTNPFGYKGAVGYYSNSDTDDIYVRARTYQPVIGRWLSMDPLGFIDGPNLYRAYFVPNDIDPAGTLVLVPKDPDFRKCGGLTHEATWKPEKGESNGIILQLICLTEFVEVCKENGDPGCEKGFPGGNKLTCPTGCYFEAWRVDNDGQVEFGGIDTFFFQRCNYTKGSRRQTGVAYFIPDEFIKANGGDVVDPQLGTGESGVANAGDLRSACYGNDIVREFFEKAEKEFKGKKNETGRNSFRNWNCCGPCLDFGDIDWGCSTTEDAFLCRGPVYGHDGYK